MPCFFPLQASFYLRDDGKKKVVFSNSRAKLHEMGVKPLMDNLAIPCGRCIGCRLEHSRQWAVRCMHEASLHSDNCFLTLTYDDEHLPIDGSLNRSVISKFIKRLRSKYCGKFKFFYCGEYGDLNRRPHYHVCVFGFDFKDKSFWKNSAGCRLYVSDELSSLWQFGFSTIGSLTFDSAAYVARYCTKKITGEQAKDHYGDLLPEFGQASLRPAIGRDWIDKFGFSDVYPFDTCVTDTAGGGRGYSKPPRYYDKRLEQLDSEAYEAMKKKRFESGLLREDESSFDRLMVKHKCTVSRFKKMLRCLDKENI